MAWGVWHTAALMRIKRLPPIESFTGMKSASQVVQTPTQMKGVFAAMRAAAASGG